jgi:hypothetical protein
MTQTTIRCPIRGSLLWVRRVAREEAKGDYLDEPIGGARHPQPGEVGVPECRDWNRFASGKLLKGGRLKFATGTRVLLSAGPWVSANP